MLLDLPAPGSPSRMELKLCVTRACEAAQLFPPIVSDASFREMSQHLVAFLGALTFAKTTQSEKTLKFIKTLTCREVSMLIIFLK